MRGPSAIRMSCPKAGALHELQELVFGNIELSKKFAKDAWWEFIVVVGDRHWTR